MAGSDKNFETDSATQTAGTSEESAIDNGIGDVNDMELQAVSEAAPVSPETASHPSAMNIIALILGSILMLALFAGALIGIALLIKFIIRKIKK